MRPTARAVDKVGATWLVLSSLAIIAYSVIPYLTAPLADLAADNTGLAEDYQDKPWLVVAAFYVHIVAGAFALVLTPVQFVRRLRDRSPRIHRWLGRAVLIAIAVAGIAALVIAPFSPAGLVGLFGFGAMAMLWLGTAWAAYRSIRRRDVASHRAWMIRNYALTYSAITLRVWLGLLIFAQVPFGNFAFDFAFANAYAAIPFLSWLPNLVVAEFLVRRRGLPSFLIAREPVSHQPEAGRASGTSAEAR